MRALAALLALGLAACATGVARDNPDTGPTLPSAADDTCGARTHMNLIGKPADTPGVPPASREVRHIRPDSIVTMDLRQDRLNVMIDKAGTILALRCY